MSATRNWAFVNDGLGCWTWQLNTSHGVTNSAQFLTLVDCVADARRHGFRATESLPKISLRRHKEKGVDAPAVQRRPTTYSEQGWQGSRSAAPRDSSVVTSKT